MRVFERLGNEIRTDNLLPERISKQFFAATIGQRLVNHVPRFDFALVMADNGTNVIVHSLEQLIARRAGAAKAEATSAAWILPVRRRRVVSLEYPVGCLAVPDQRMPDDVHAVFLAELYILVGRFEVVTFLSRTRMNELPFQYIFGGNGVELLLNQCDCIGVLFCELSWIQCHANFKTALEGVFQSNRGVLGHCTRCNRQQRRHE